MIDRRLTVHYLRAAVDLAVLRLSTMCPSGSIGYGFRVSILPGRPGGAR